MSWLSHKLAAPILLALAILLGAGLVWQTVRIDGFPFFGPGYRGLYAECQTAEAEREKLRRQAEDKAREEGRLKALADGAAIDKDDQDRQKKLDDTTKNLADIAKDLMKPRPPIHVMVENEPPVVITPPMAMSESCALNREALEAFRDQLNQGRSP